MSCKQKQANVDLRVSRWTQTLRPFGEELRRQAPGE